MKIRGAKVSKLDPACNANSDSRLMETLLIKHQSWLSEGSSRKIATTAPRGGSGPVQFTSGAHAYQAGSFQLSGTNRAGNLRFLRRTVSSKKPGPFPKCNRMTHPPHGVKVEAKIVD